MIQHRTEDPVRKRDAERRAVARTVGSAASAPGHVVIAGGGFAALEAALALRELAGDRVRLTLVAPEPLLSYRPAATSEPFDDLSARAYDLAAIAADLGATYHRVRLEAVAPKAKRVRLSSGARLSYDALVLAIGARARSGIPGAFTFRDQRDVPMFRHVLEEIDEGTVRRLVFAIPTGCTWPLPIYELALLSATRAKQRDLETQITVVSAEAEPLAAFGTRAADVVGSVLADLDVRFVGRAAPGSVRRDGALTLGFDGAIEAERVIAAPQLRGQRISGVPASWWGFVPTRPSGRVEGLVDVYAAGDMTTFPIKQGSLAAQQADRIAQAIAEGLGVPVREPSPPHVLLARLLAGEVTVSLRTELDERGQVAAATIEHFESRGAARSVKVFGRYLTPYLELHSAAAGRPAAA